MKPVQICLAGFLRKSEMCKVLFARSNVGRALGIGAANFNVVLRGSDDSRSVIAYLGGYYPRARANNQAGRPG